MIQWSITMNCPMRQLALCSMIASRGNLSLLQWARNSTDPFSWPAHVLQRLRMDISRCCSGCAVKFLRVPGMNAHVLQRLRMDISRCCSGCAVKFLRVPGTETHFMQLCGARIVVNRMWLHGSIRNSNPNLYLNSIMYKVVV
jgi:hypothetical protein